jgi:hypothetical protein
MDTNESSKNNKITDSLISNASIIFLLPIIAYILSYGFNWGYNSFFYIPSYLTPYSFSPILNNFGSFLIFSLVSFFIFYFIIFCKHILNPTDNSRINKVLNKMPSILIILFTIIFSIFSIITKMYWMLFILIPTIATNFYLKYLLKRSNKIKNRLEDESNITPDELEEIQSEVHQLLKSSKIPLLDIFQKISLIIMALLISFMVMYVYGSYKASQQNIFYTTGNNNVIINTIDDNYITVHIYKKDSTSSYYFKPKYTLVPINELPIEIIYLNSLKTDTNINIKSTFPFNP